MPAKTLDPRAAERKRLKQALADAASPFQALTDKAHEAGMAAGAALNAERWNFVERENPFDDSSPVKIDYGFYEPCGSAWIRTAGNTAFARWAKRNGWRKDSYAGGILTSAKGFGQSYQRKLAYAEAYAAVLREAGIKAYADGRLD